MMMGSKLEDLLGGFFVLVLFSVSHLAASEQNEEMTFKFTQDVYNATINENSIGKTYVTPLSKMGIYLSPALPDVKYSISSGDTSRLFKPEARRAGNFCFLRVRTRSGVQAVNREQEDLYELTIKATLKYKNSILTATTELIVNVIDMNDLSPLFDRPDYSVDVPENVTLHQSIARPIASDADIGINGEIYYSFAQFTETFAIHPTSGVITVTHPLSFAEQSHYRLDVLARDRGPVQGREARVSRTSLQIRVLEVNQNSPQIDLQELPTIVEHGKVGTIYAVLRVTDSDDGRNGQIGKVEIADGNGDGYFRVQTGQKDFEYLILVAKDIDRELNPNGFNLTIMASDKGNASRSSSITLHVKLQDTNDHSPQFPSDYIQASIEECSPIHTPIVFVTALDTDCGKNAELVYSIVSGNSLGLFSINSVTGLVSVSGLLDAETWTSINLTVQAQDLANRGSRKASTVKLKVDIIDCNDNSPVFGAIPVVVYVEENQPVMTSVFRVEAHDADSGENGFISFSLANIETVPFAIDHFKGDIATKEPLDYESMRRSYNLIVRASDWGSPFRRESEIILHIRIKDVNDNRPLFEKVNCTGYLSKEAPIGTELLVVSAIDFDFGNIVSYHIISGNNDELFDLDSSTGSLKLRQSLKGDRTSFRQIMVTASDGTNSADPLSINISLVNRNRKVVNSDASFNCFGTNLTEELNRILRIAEQNNQGSGSDLVTSSFSQFSQNLNSPRFSDNPTHIVVPEGLDPGSKIMTINASDGDQGYNGRLQFSITGGNDQDVFKIDTYTGDLYVIGNLDREFTDEYRLNITVSDMGKVARRSSMLLQVNVTDINDNAPEFNQSVYVVNVPEDAKINSIVCTVKAVDKDFGPNGRVGYSITDSADAFSIDARNGSIVLVRALDREKVSEYSLSVVATDRSSDRPLSSMIVVRVKVNDVNDNAPKFYPASYDVHVLEDIPVGTVVANLFAKDPDVGLGGMIRYDLMDGTDEHFKIDQLTGAIRVMKELNFDKKQVYNITARARDRGEPSLFTEALLMIMIVDVNNNRHAPVFKDIVFTCHVRENQPPRTSVMQVLATDNDAENPAASPRDFQIVYSIRNGTGLGLFTIDSRGMIYTRQPLDRETRTHYWLTVYAQDMGSVPLSSMTEIYIEIDDVNDNAPQTENPVYYTTVQENSSIYTSVLQLVAYDLDDLSSNHIVYDITSGNPQGFFSINRTSGLITTGHHRLLDREKQEEHILEVTISDNGVPTLSSVTRIVVKVGDLNDEEPKFLDRQHRVRIPRLSAEFLDRGLYRVFAVDRDVGANAQLDYSIVPNKENTDASETKFRIDSKSGIIYAVSVLDAEKQYDLQVKAVDNGWPPLNATTRVILTVMDIPAAAASGNPPKFKTDGVQVPLMESDEIGHLVSLLSASDADGDKIWYFITGGNDNDTFSIDTENGNILLARLLDSEIRKSYNLTVEATDGHFWTKTWVFVTVLDVNDNAPQFELPLYEVNVSENAPVGTNITSVVATDADEDRRLFYTIHSATSSASLTKFRINSETGVITTLQELNREAVAQHELTVMVRDQGALSKRSLTKVIIHVLDLNDHAPEFLEETTKAWVYSSALIGSQVLQVVAYDADKGSNAEITYSISSGNIGGMFGIDATLGIVYVARSLESSPRKEYSITVKASDNGIPSLFSTSVVQIEVVTSNNSPPKFDQLEYNAEIAENQPMDSFIAVVRATCQSSVLYELVGGKDEAYFNINPSSGVLVSNALFDYEVKSFYNLTIRATSIMGSSAQTVVYVHIADVNDNAPAFIQGEFVGNISESSTPGSYVLDRFNSPLVIRATDADSGRNCLLLYQIIDARAQDIFYIDPSTGAIKTKVILDRELVEFYEFTVQALDHGEPPKSATVGARVRIYIDDVNDSPPVFTQRLYRATLLLPTQPDVALVELLASDADLASNAVLEYGLVRGNGKENFAVDSKTGILTVVNVDEMLDSYELTVRVSDGQFDDTAVVQVSVDFRQASGLQFLNDIYEGSLPENVMEVRNITVVQAIGQALNEHLTFTLLNSKGLFKIKPTSGVVQTTGLPFDRETRSNYVLVVEVRDERVPVRIAHCLVNVTIIDINDYVPVFLNQPYFVVVPVDAKVGEVIKTLAAVDHDIGTNGIVDFFLMEGDETLFAVRQETGKIVTRRALSATDGQVQHRLLIEARDRGNPSLKSQAEVKITIVDRASPVFDEPFYSVLVPESIPLHSALITIFARSSTGGKIVYSIIKGDDFGEFSIDFNTGILSTSDHLDYETSKLHELTVRALDIQSGSYGDAIVQVTVEDVNDHQPVFEKPRYVATIPESVSVGSSVLTVLATDEDSGNNAKVWYQIEPHPLHPTHTAFFHIDSTRGVISAKQKLDHEQIKQLKFTVVASDSGYPQTSSSVSVTVNVTDTNDNPPKFEQLTYEVTISDQAKRGQFLLVLLASDDDSSDRGRLRYAIVGGNAGQMFKIDSFRATLSVTDLRKTEFLPTYSLNVSVTDGVFTSFTRVRVNVEGTNLHKPQFSQLLYVVDVYEQQALGQLIVVVNASDADSGINGVLAYKIINDELDDLFAIDANSGTIMAKSVLLCKTSPVYLLRISATDGGGRVGQTTVRVNVLCQGDRIPVFVMNEYKANVYAASHHGSSVVKITALEPDAKNREAKKGLTGLEYSLVLDGGNASRIQYFMIDTSSGLIIVNSSLIGLENELLQYFVRAKRRDVPVLYSDVSVEIYVMSSLDRPPLFEKNIYSFFVIESRPVGSVIATIAANSNDSLTYRIVQGNRPSANTPPVFGIDDNGVVKIVNELDRESVERFELSIRAETQASPGLVAHAAIVIHVQDVNDNRPKFVTNHFIAGIAENGIAGEKVVQIEAYDPDAGANGEIEYELSGGDQKSLQMFGIDPKTGWITCVASLDRELVREHKFEVIATDRGASSRLSSSAAVTIHVIDRNDEAPVFAQSHYGGAVNEDALPGTIILMIVATDLDQEPNNIINFHISEGDPYGQFNIRKTGELYVNRELDRESKPLYDLVVLATDGTFVSSARVSITILDANDNAPVCDQDDYQKIVPENLGLGSFVIRVSAQDIDEPGTRNSRVEYYLENNETNAFAINKRTGIVTSRQFLDRETVSEYYLKVIAQDGGGLSCTSYVTIQLSDINDNAPVFTRTNYVAMVPENFGSKMLVTRVAALDADLDINKRVSYSMDDSDGIFTIDPTSGVITLQRSLDREERDAYNLTVYASDQGHPRLSSSAMVTILLVDVNDNPPEFERSIYLVAANESVAIGTVIGKVFAASRDVGVNAEITYVMREGDDDLTFDVKRSTGEIVVTQNLDYERVREYSLTIVATDGGSPPLSSTAVVKIDVLDENDNAPTFVRPSYEFSILEDVVINTTIVQMEAVDIDSGQNGMIEFHVVDQSTTETLFSIDPFTGLLVTTAPLDREKVAVHDLLVVAVDKGEPRKTSSIQVKIVLIDVNDCHPQFMNENFTASIQADIGLGSSVFSLEVRDEDQSPNGEPFVYDIIDGGQQKFFIDKGVIKTTSIFNRSIKDVYVIRVRVLDNGSPPLYSDVDVTIYITEQSVSPPVITSLKVTVVAFDDTFPPSIIGQMKAVDPDIHDRLTFALLAGHDLFDIDQMDGTLRTIEPLDAGEYSVNVSVTDGRFLRYADVKVIVEGITSDMIDNAVVVRLEYLSAEDFVTLHRSAFVSALKVELSVKERDIHVLGMQPASETEVVPGRRKRNAESHLDILIAVQRSQNKYFKGGMLKRRLEQSQNAVEQASGVKISKVFNNACTKDSCKEGDCQTTFKFENDSPYNVLTDEENYVIIPFVLVYKCVCKPGSTGPLCAEKLDVCNPGLCKEPKICNSNGQSYTCSCPEGRTGDDCNENVEPPCTDALCRKDKPMTLSGTSYIQWRLTVPLEKRLSLSLELRTVQANARLMHAAGRVDYSILEIDDGFIQYRFDCGSGPGLARITRKVVNDGQWHMIVVERTGKSVRIVLDGQYSAEGSAPGTNDVLNLHSNDVFFGAEVELLPPGIEEIRQGFIGCLRKITIDHVDLPLLGSSSVAVLQHLQDIEFHCRGVYVPGICSSAPCRNGGSCFPLGGDTYMCKCRNRFLGAVCEIDTNPCASDPCLHGGQCEVVLNNFKCICPGRTKGRRCELDKFCDPNPCRNGARCSDGKNGPSCGCLKGYQGQFCELDVDECKENPCDNDGICHNVNGGFTCNCTAMTSGELCDVLIISAVSSSPWNIRIEEIIGIAVSGFVLLVVAILLIFLCRCYRHKQRQRRLQQRSKLDDADIFEKHSRQELQENGRNVMLMNSLGHNRDHSPAPDSTLPKPSPQPPPLPRRPASYTPSAAESFNMLNAINSDVARNYGSAADDLENAGTCKRTETPVFLQNCEAQKSPRTVRVLPQPPIDEDPTLKDLNNLNKAENYRKNQKKLNKMIPSANPSLQSLQLLHSGASISSLPISESESDLQTRINNIKTAGYHWDMSDLDPNATLYLKSPELARKIQAIGSQEYAVNGEDFVDGNESEYVGDSEFTENELGNEDVEMETDSYPGLSFKQILAMKDELNYGSDEFTPPRKYNVHPNNYLPEHDVSKGSHPGDWTGEETPEVGSLNGNFNSADYICRDDDDDVIHYGFPRSTSASKFNRNSYTDTEIGPNVLDNMSASILSVGGCKSANDSVSDLSGVCMIEDSEANNSDEDNVDEIHDVKKRLLSKVVASTQV